jgi:hypothetical protein
MLSEPARRYPLMRRCCVLIFALSVGLMLPGCDRKEHDSPAVPKGSGIVWPDLKEFPSFRHRLATQQDIDDGHAAFLVPGPDGPRGTPINVEVPQYAFQIDKEHHTKTPCVLIQAVEVDGFKMGACVSLPDRAHHVATIDEFELLGTRPPG